MSTMHVRSDEGRSYPMIDGDHIAKAAVHDDAGGFEVFEVRAPARATAPPHVSPWSGVLFLLEGRVTALVDGTAYDVEPGDLVVFPAGTPSTFEVVGEAARFLAITSGHGAGRFFADFSSSVPADRPVEESFGEILAVTQRHGISVAGV
jgi:quercetin dioxygenase-like cupin family protein